MIATIPYCYESGEEQHLARDSLAAELTYRTADQLWSDNKSIGKRAIMS